MKKAKIFDKLIGKLEPFLEFEDLGGLKIYHPSMLPKKASLAIFQSQQKVDFINDEIEKLSDELEKLRKAEELDQANFDARELIGQKIYAKREEADSEIFEYIAQLAKSDQQSVKALFVKTIKEQGVDIEVSQFAQEVFSMIADELMAYRDSEMKTEQSGKSEVKK